MKNYYQILFFLISLILVGCQSDYVVSKWYSKEELYKNFNESCSDKSVKIIFVNDSSFTASGGARISNDTLLFITQERNNNVGFVPLSNIKRVSYNKNWLGIPFGSLTGAVVGTLAGAFGLIPVYESHPNMSGGQTQDIETGGAMLLGLVAGTVVGSVIGWLIGYNYIYFFNP